VVAVQHITARRCSSDLEVERAAALADFSDFDVA
jgi:hypothetical protein